MFMAVQLALTILYDTDYKTSVDWFVLKLTYIWVTKHEFAESIGKKTKLTKWKI